MKKSFIAWGPGQHADPEIRKYFHSDIEDGCHDSPIEILQKTYYQG